MSLLEVERLAVSYTRGGGTIEAVSDVSFSMGRGEILGLVGESGSGKTTLGLAVPQLLPGTGRITRGSIRFDGTDLTSASREELGRIRGKRVAVIFQDPSTSLNPVLTVGEQIAETIRLHRDTGESTSVWVESLRKFAGPLARRGKSWAAAVQMLEMTGIPDPEANARRYPHQLSGGMRQRAAIAMALSSDPDLIVADEPTTALDVTVQATILRQMVDLVRSLNISALLITHDLGVASQICDRLAVMYAGQLFETSSAQEVFENPQNPYTQALLASHPDLEDRVGELVTVAGDVPDLSEEQSGCRFASRCPEVIPDCRVTLPVLNRLSERLVTHDADHWCRCIRREDARSRSTS
jgi:peptide/nickel transport system ATP-binding protein